LNGYELIYIFVDGCEGDAQLSLRPGSEEDHDTILRRGRRSFRFRFRSGQNEGILLLVAEAVGIGQLDPVRQVGGEFGHDLFDVDGVARVFEPEDLSQDDASGRIDEFQLHGIAVAHLSQRELNPALDGQLRPRHFRPEGYVDHPDLFGDQLDGIQLDGIAQRLVTLTQGGRRFQVIESVPPALAQLPLTHERRQRRRGAAPIQRVRQTRDSGRLKRLDDIAKEIVAQVRGGPEAEHRHGRRQRRVEAHFRRQHRIEKVGAPGLRRRDGADASANPPVVQRHGYRLEQRLDVDQQWHRVGGAVSVAGVHRRVQDHGMNVNVEDGVVVRPDGGGHRQVGKIQAPVLEVGRVAGVAA